MTTSSELTAVPELLQRLAQKRPQGVACRWQNTDGTWSAWNAGELWTEVRRVEAAFRALGLKHGDRLAIVARNCPEWLVAEMAALNLGAVVVGIDANASAEQTVASLNQVPVRALVVDSTADLAKVPRCLRDRMAFVVVLDETADRGGVISWHSIRLHDSVPQETVPGPDADDLATVIFTSGTTGAAKAIPYNHHQLLVACTALAENSQIQAGDEALCWLPLAHFFQRMLNLVTLARGATIAFVANPRTILSALREVRPAFLPVVPRFLEKLREEIEARLAGQVGWRRALVNWGLAAGAAWSRCQRAGVSPSRWLRVRHALADRLILRRIRAGLGNRLRFLVTGSAPAAPGLLEFFHQIGILVFEAYGVSENTVPVAANRPGAYRFGSVGRPFAPNAVRLADDGVVLVYGPGLFHGYCSDDGADCFTADGFYRTGDLGRFDTDGYLYLLGRKGDVIKTSTGRRIAPARVESAYRRCPGVDQVVVFGEGRKHLVGLVTLNGTGAAAGAMGMQDFINGELRRHGETLAKHERVAAFAVLPERFTLENGELTPTLKLRRREIEARYRDTIARLYEHARPRTLVAEVLS
jgi:long-chain acyl-CoA synthetase